MDSDAQNGLLRSTLGFNGLIVSDCDAIADAFQPHGYCSNESQAAAQGIKAGCDLDCGSTYKVRSVTENALCWLYIDWSKKSIILITSSIETTS